MNDQFKIIADVIKNRRSIKPVKMNGKKIPDADVKELLALANWAPTHGRTEPWKFIVYSGESAQEFGRQHAELYRTHTDPQKFEQGNFDKLLHNGDLASHIIIAIMQRGNSPKVPVLEEIAATAAAVENMLLGATAAGITSFWSSGGMTHKKEFKEFLQLREEDVVLGLLYFGYSDDRSEGKRQTEIEHKVTWK